jgi:hypothetical protein
MIEPQKMVKGVLASLYIGTPLQRGLPWLTRLKRIVQLPFQTVESARPKRYPMVQLPTQSVENGRSGFSLSLF